MPIPKPGMMALTATKMLFLGKNKQNSVSNPAKKCHVHLVCVPVSRIDLVIKLSPVLTKL